MPGGTVVQFSPTAAQNLLFALSDLRNAQNNFMSVWLNHHAQRMILMRELGLMELDNDGLWIDRPLSEIEFNEEEEVYMPPPVPTEWFRLAGVDDETAKKLLAEGIDKTNRKDDPAQSEEAETDGDTPAVPTGETDSRMAGSHSGRSRDSGTGLKVMRVSNIDALPAKSISETSPAAELKPATEQSEARKHPAANRRTNPSNDHRISAGPGS
jgi:hypothetical protein